MHGCNVWGVVTHAAVLQLGVWRPSSWMQLQLQALDMSLRCLGRRITLVQLLFESAAAAPWCWRLSHDPIGVLKCACRRITLVQLLFESAAAAPLPETDPELRAALLDSLKSYEAAERARARLHRAPAGAHPRGGAAAGAAGAPR